MGVDHPGSVFQEIQRKAREERQRGTATLQNASIGRAGLRIYDGGWLRIENGGLSVTGTEVVTGRLEGSGVFDWTGPLFLRGNTGITGILQVTGATTLAGSLRVTGLTTLDADVTLNSDLNLGSGRITAGPLVIDRLGPQAGRIAASAVLVLDAGNAIALRNNTVVSGALVADSLDINGPKNFRMDHPSKPGHWLRHGSTESPVSGTEYTGRAKIGADGSAVVKLPDYFEALNKPEGRTVQLTPVGRPFPVGADDVADGRFTLYGSPGREVFWLVKAERFGGDFLLEEQMPGEGEGE